MASDAKAKVERVVMEGISTAEVRDIYKGWAGTYDEDLVNYKRTTVEESVASIKRYEKQDCKILDLAAGTGNVAGKLLAEGYVNIDAYDGSEEMLEVAKSKNLYKNIYCQYIGTNKSPGISDNTYDVIVAVGSFYPGHLNETCLPEVLRMLKKGGRFYFTVAVNCLTDSLQTGILHLEESGILQTVEKRFVQNIHSHGDGFVFILQKC